MNIKNINSNDIAKNSKINSRFISSNNSKLKITCQFYKGNFYADSFNYFPITNDNFTFKELFSWDNKEKFENFFTNEFNAEFIKNKENFKKLQNITLLGSSVSNNYYRNLITFLPRIFFIQDKNINLAIHRNSSNKFRNFLKEILDVMQIKINKFIYLDDSFYYFEDSLIPQFLTQKISIEILNKKFSKQNKLKKRIYITRKNASYRKIVNESDLIGILKEKKFEILDTEQIDIKEQIKIFSNSEVVISPTGSALANIIFCNPGTKIIEIMPKYRFAYENVFSNRYYRICKLLKLNYQKIESDPIDIKKIDKSYVQFIGQQALNSSNYYKNLLVKIKDFKKIIDKI